MSDRPAPRLLKEIKLLVARWNEHPCDYDACDCADELSALVREDFCRACGASIPPREGEGTCPVCQPALVREQEPQEKK